MDFVRRTFLRLRDCKRGISLFFDAKHLAKCALLIAVGIMGLPRQATAQTALPNFVPGFDQCDHRLCPDQATAYDLCVAIATTYFTGGSCYLAPNETSPPYNYYLAYQGGQGITTGWPAGSLYNGSRKNNGRPTCRCAGDPIDLATGNEFLEETDFDSPTLPLVRYYNSQAVALGRFGNKWRHTYDQSLAYITDGQNQTVVIHRADGQDLGFNKNQSQWTSDSDVASTLSEITDANGNATSWSYFDASTQRTELYDAAGHWLSFTLLNGQTTTLTYSDSNTPSSIAPTAGLLISVTDPRGRSLQFVYNANGLVAGVTLPDNTTVNYKYSALYTISEVDFSGGANRAYSYNESNLSTTNTPAPSLTGITDESGVRYADISYDDAGRATRSQIGGIANLTQVAYNTDGTTAVIYPSGVATTFNFATISYSAKQTSASTACQPACVQSYKSETYDGNGYPLTATDFNGNVTATTFNSVGLLTQQIDAQGQTSQRTTQTDWNTILRVPTEHRARNASNNLVARTDWTYNNRGQALARCDVDPQVSYTCSNSGTVPTGVRRWTYTYCDTVSASPCPIVGLLLTVTGSRTDLTQTTTYSYYTTSSATNCSTPGGACHQLGDLYQITDALGHVTTYASYDGAGRITRITDANGVNTDMTYTPRGWLASRSVGGSTTTFTYMPYGEVQTITDPDGVVTTFGYDSAHRLTDITDAQGNDLHYTLDAAGNKTAEQISTAAGTVVHRLSRSYNALGQLTAVIDGLNQTVFNAGYSDSYDANGNLTHSADGLSIQRQQTYDALNRLKSTLDNYNGTDTATANTTTTTNQDALDRVASVTDPSGLVTNYTHDGLGNLTTLQSPDSGTSTTTFDAAGNALTHTDAKGTVATSTYDALDRKTRTTYTDTTANVTYTYDEANSVTGCAASAPIGRLTRMVEQAVSTTYCYDARGNVIQKTQVVSGTTDSTSYRYTAADRLSGETAPDGTVIGYAFDSDGRISGVQVMPSGSTTASTAVSSVTYLPFGPINGYTLGNGQTVTRAYDANYQLTDLTSPALALHFARDAMGDITALGNAPGANPATESYQYDPLYRLTGVSNSSGVLESYTYNPTGDRLSKTASGLATGAYSYTSGTHQLASIGNAPRANDANGNTTGSVIGGQTYGFAYDPRQRIALAQANGATVGTYTYNAIGERVGKVTSSNERFVYNEARQLIAEYGATNRDYIWLDDLPVAAVDNTTTGSTTASTVNYVTADQLGTPRAVTNSAGTVIWSWAYAGNAFEEQQPTSSGYVLNLRSAGEYYDAETGSNNNGYRTREPATWRFLQTDPIGLVGGISTYTAVENNPLSNIDPQGLDDTQCMYDPASCGMANNLPAAVPVPQALVDYSAGLGDAASLGVTSLIRDAMGTNDEVDECSTAYEAGGWSSFALGAGRLAYAGLAKVGAEAAASGLEASAFRSGLRKAFGGGNSFRPPNLAKYTTDDALRAAAGRTNTLGNALGAGAAATGAYEGSGAKCGCQK